MALSSESLSLWFLLVVSSSQKQRQHGGWGELIMGGRNKNQGEFFYGKDCMENASL